MDYKQLLLGVGIIGLIAFGAYTYSQTSGGDNMYGSATNEVEEIEDSNKEEVTETETVGSGMLVPDAEGVDEMIVVPDSAAEIDVAEEAMDTTSSDTTSDAQTYTLAEVAEHASEDSCWTAVDGKVYDLTPALETHPGGKQNIMKICGIDGTSAFMKKHGSDDRPQEGIGNLYIGALVE